METEANDTSGAVAYLRRSRVDETRTGAVSYEAQEAAVRTMARRWDHDDVPILVDWGRSGGSERRRPGYQQLRAMIEAGQVRDVFSYDLSRLTRSLEEWVKLATLCRERGVRIHLSREGTFDFSTASGEMLANILASVAQAVRRWASERSTETITALRARGEPIGRRPYGSRPGEDLEAVKAAYIEAGSFYGAARLLNGRGLPTLKGKAWLASSVGWIIRHQAPELTSARAGTAGPRHAARFALQRLVRCPCGRLLSPYSYMNGRKLSTVYRCPGARSLPDHPRPFSIPETVLLAWAKTEASHLALPPGKDQLAYREETSERRGELDGRRVRILDMFEAGHIDRDERDRRLAPIYAELERMDGAAGAAVLDIPNIDWGWPPEQLNVVLRALWTRIEIGPDMRPLRAEWLVPEWRAA